MRYAVVALVETALRPKQLLNEIRSALEFDAAKTRTTVESIVVLTESGRTVASSGSNQDRIKGRQERAAAKPRRARGWKGGKSRDGSKAPPK